MASKQFQRDLLRALGTEGVAYVMPKLVSSKGKPVEPFKKAIRVRVESATEGGIYIPHYWAVYVHDGRKLGPWAKKPKGRYFVWWNDPRQDPRLRGRGGVTPERASQLRTLSKVDFAKAFKEHRLATKEGRTPNVVITRQIKKATPPVRFFDNGVGMAGFWKRANAVGQLHFRAYALWEMRAALGLTSRIPITSAAPVILKPIVTPIKLFL